MRKESPKIVDYVPPVVAFVAAIAALVGAPKWDVNAPGFSKITSLGWTVFGIGFAALVSSLLVTRRNHRLQHSQKALRAEIASIGGEQILRHVVHLTSAFRNSTLWHDTAPEPESPAELLDTDRRAALASLNLNQPSPYYDGKDYPAWWAIFQDTAKYASERLTATLQIYVTFMDPEQIQITSKLLSCEFMHRLQHMKSIIDANTRDDPKRPVTFFWVAPDQTHRCGYEEFWELVTELFGLFGDDSTGGPIKWPSRG